MTYKQGMRRPNHGTAGWGADYDLFSDRSKNAPSACTASWTDERVADLKKLWSEGFSASYIAERLGGTTRNAVIGKVSRLGLVGKRLTTTTQANRRARIARQKKQPKPTKSPLRILIAEALPAPRPDDIARVHLIAEALPAPRPDDIARVHLIDLEPHHCKYPVGEPTKGFCGLNRHPGSPYCTGHSHLCFRVADVVPRRTQPAKQLETA